MVGDLLFVQYELDHDHKCHPGTKLSFAKSGLRLLLTGEDCKRQVPHLDFMHPGPDKKDKKRYWGTPMPNPNFAILATGAVSSCLLVRPRSHVYLNGAASMASQLLPALNAKVVHIPPFSVMFSRGDMEHAGPGWSDHRENTKEFDGIDLESAGGQRDPRNIYGHYLRIHSMAIREGESMVNDLVFTPGGPAPYIAPYDSAYVPPSSSDSDEESDDGSRDGGEEGNQDGSEDGRPPGSPNSSSSSASDSEEIESED